jgi:hypothetical protein
MSKGKILEKNTTYQVTIFSFGSKCKIECLKLNLHVFILLFFATQLWQIFDVQTLPVQ